VKLDLAERNGRWLVLAASLLVCFGVWRWAGTILVPEFTAQAVAEGRPIGNNSDLYPRWLGTRELLLHGRDPYSADVTRQIQIGYYGRQLDPKKPADPIDQVAFAYPGRLRPPPRYFAGLNSWAPHAAYRFGCTPSDSVPRACWSSRE
jgi:hypothetical protein